MIKSHPFYPNIGIPYEECWEDVPGYEGLYKASTHGRVKSLGRMKWGGDRVQWYWLKGGVKKVDSKLVNMVDKDGVGKLHKLHHVILNTFVGPKPEGMECCHYDGNDSNNRLENLRWDTHLNNEDDKKRHGTGNLGEQNGSCKVNKDIVLEMRKLYSTGSYSYSKLKTRFGLSIGTISGIINGVGWNYPDCYPEGYVIPKKRTRAECFKGVNRWNGNGCKEEVI
jgi:hypothetical protein